MVDISVGQASGLIATGVFVVQFSILLALPILLAAYIAEKNSVVTWSVLGRFLHASFWPSILQTDSAAANGVPRRVTFVGLFQTIALTLITVASIVTPLGLYDAIAPSDKPQLEPFKFLPDPSAFGRGTPPRSTAPFTRSCGDQACPGASKNETCVRLVEGGALVCNNTVYDRLVPEDLTALFRDGTTRFSPPVSSIFDIQWRTHLNASDPFSSLGYYLRSAYRQITTLILEPGLHVVDGLIVNTQDGGIGFRNHTVPTTAQKYGSTWSEDILFIEPETQCVDLNFTFNFHLEESYNNPRPAVKDIFLKDHGGFSDLARVSPVSSMSSPPPYHNGQGELDLRERAYNVAWLNNFLTMVYFNLTNPDMTDIQRIDVTPGMEIRGAKSTVRDENSTFYLEYQSIRSSSFYGEYLVFNESVSGNPHKVRYQDFVDITSHCVHSTSMESANLNSSLVGCGLFYGAARRTDGGDRLIPDPGSQWEIPVYSCASSIRAIIRSASFVYNGTTFDSLKVTSAKPKHYPSPADLPLWGVEDMQNFTINEARPLWGVIGPANATVLESLSRNISTISQETLRLPGTLTEYSFSSTFLDPVTYNTGENLPGASFYVQALRNAFNIGRPTKVAFGDYSGQTQLALFALWQNLSTTATDASKILNLVWTDIAANSVVGTKGWGLTSSVAGKSAVNLAAQHSNAPVTSYRKRVRFHMPYAIPAFVVLAVTLAILVASVFVLVTRKTSMKKLRDLLDATSNGRIISLYEWPEEARGLKTDDWVQKIGSRQAAVSTKFVAAGERMSTWTEEEQIKMMQKASTK